jgi:cell division control protein 6
MYRINKNQGMKTMEINYLENQYLNKTLFKREECLEINYLPDKIFHREQELILLSKIFIRLIEKPFLISRKVLIQGAVGIGKTLITKTFGDMLKKSAEKRKINLQYIHINCRIEKTNYSVLYQILMKMKYPIPKRGFSSQELISILHDYLIKQNIYLLLILDELNYLNLQNFDLIYSLTRLNEISNSDKSYLSLITIVRDITLLSNLDNSTLSSLQGNILSLKKYSVNQIIDILKQRIDLSLNDGIFPDEMIEYIADTIFNSGDLRNALNIVRNSVKIAELKDRSHVILDDIHIAMKNLIPSLQDNVLKILNNQQILLLYALTITMINNSKSPVVMKDIKEQYQRLCLEYNIQSRKSTQIWENLQILKNYNLIKIDNRSKEIKGRKSFFKINNIPLELLQDNIQKRLDSLFGCVNH